jgi:hypothetical protein
VSLGAVPGSCHSGYSETVWPSGFPRSECHTDVFTLGKSQPRRAIRGGEALAYWHCSIFALWLLGHR